MREWTHLHWPEDGGNEGGQVHGGPGDEQVAEGRGDKDSKDECRQ